MAVNGPECPRCGHVNGIHAATCISKFLTSSQDDLHRIVRRLFSELETISKDKYINFSDVKRTLEEVANDLYLLRLLNEPAAVGAEHPEE